MKGNTTLVLYSAIIFGIIALFVVWGVTHAYSPLY